MRKLLNIILICLLTVTSAHAQKFFIFGRVGEMDSFKASITPLHLKLPADTLTNPFFSRAGSVYLNQSNGTIYWHNGSVWAPIAGGGGGGFTLTTNDVRGVATYSAGVLNIPNYSVDTSRIYDSLAAMLRVRDSGVKYTTPNYVNSLNAIVSGDVQTLQADVTAIDSAVGVAFTEIGSLKDSLGNYVTYTGATANVNLGTHSLTTNKVVADTVQAKSSMGLHLHGTGGEGIMIGAGGGGNITLDAYRTTVMGDSVLTTNSSGNLLRYDLKGKLFTYLLKSDSTLYQPKYRSDTSNNAQWVQINLRQLISDTSTWDATRTYVQSGTFTLSNKTINTSRWMPRADSITSNANPSINTDNVSYYEIKAQAANMNVTTTGTPVMGQQLCVCWTGTGSFTATFNTSSFEAGAQALPTTITTTKQCAVFLYNTISLRWRFAGSF